MSNLILLSGIPGTGKSTFARFLAEKHGWGHYDMDAVLSTDPQLTRLFVDSPSRFALTIAGQHPGGALIDWGFPPDRRPVVEELRLAGARLLWFAGNYQRARRNFVNRGTPAPEFFDRQLRAIRGAMLPKSYVEFQVIQAFGPLHEFRSPEDIFAEILGSRLIT